MRIDSILTQNFGDDNDLLMTGSFGGLIVEVKTRLKVKTIYNWVLRCHDVRKLTVP